MREMVGEVLAGGCRREARRSCAVVVEEMGRRSLRKNHPDSAF